MNRKMAKTDSSPNPEDYGIPARLKYLRTSREYSQAALAHRAKLSQSTIAQIESGAMDPSIKTLEKISKALDVEPAIFFMKSYVLVFDLRKLKKRYDKLDKLNPTIYKSLDQIVRYAREIGFI